MAFARVFIRGEGSVLGIGSEHVCGTCGQYGIVGEAGKRRLEHRLPSAISRIQDGRGDHRGDTVLQPLC